MSGSNSACFYTALQSVLNMSPIIELTISPRIQKKKKKVTRNQMVNEWDERVYLLIFSFFQK